MIVLTEPQKGRLRDAAKGLADGLNNEQLRRLYFLIDDILQYGPILAAHVIHKTLDEVMEGR